MKIIGNYVLQSIDTDYVLIPIGNNPQNYRGMCSFNETGAFIWHQLEKGKSEEALLEAVTSLYDVDTDIAKRDVGGFLERLEEINIIKR